jgi:hypothetical protein
MLEEESLRMSWTLQAEATPVEVPASAPPHPSPLPQCGGEGRVRGRTGYFFLGYSLQYPYYHAFCKQKSAKSLLTSLYKREE